MLAETEIQAHVRRVAEVGYAIVENAIEPDAEELIHRVA
jgi:hypothetical protein